MYTNFAMTGDWMRSTRGALEDVIERGVKVVILDGDAVSFLSLGLLALSDRYVGM